ncbi:glycosyltransferase [Paracoccaceae bacterium]|nr:glycosyltransferase [Paracoccaceae bacterium]
MNSLLDTSSGASMSIRDLLKNLVNFGWEARAITATCFDAENGKASLSKFSEIDNLEELSVFEINDGPLKHKVMKTASWERKTVRTIEETQFWRLTLNELAEFEPDVVMSYGARTLDLLTQYEARYRGIITASYLVNSSYSSNRAFLDSQFIFTDTQNTAAYYKSKLNINPIPVGKFIDTKKIFAQDKTRENILFVNPAPAKGGFIVAQIVDWFHRKHPNIKFDIVSSRSNWSEIVEAYKSHKNKNIEYENVEEIEHQLDMRDMFSRARVTLVPSLWFESGARIIAESILNEIPCIATDSGGNREMIGQAGTIFKLPKEYHQSPYTGLLPEEAVEAICSEIVKYFNIDFYNKKVEACRTEKKKFNALENAKKVSDLLSGALSDQGKSNWHQLYKERHYSNAPLIIASESGVKTLFLPDDNPAKVIKNTANKLIFRDNEGSIIKRYSEASRETYFNEKNALETLRGYPGIVKVKDYCDVTFTIKMDDAGHIIDRQNAPTDWREKLSGILSTLRTVGIKHNDIEEYELLVNSHNELTLIDFEYATIDAKDASILSRKDRVFDDRDTECRIAKKLEGFKEKSELHCFILWDVTEVESVRSAILEKFEILYQIKYFPRALNKLGGRNKVLDQIYPFSKHNYGKKGQTAFELFVIVDNEPRYEEIYDKNFRGHLVVNRNTHELKQVLRNGRQGYLHASNNILETLDALEALTMFDKKVPSSMYDIWRPKFKNFEDLFARLDRLGVNYCVLRNFEMLPDEYQIDEHGDIDILVENYFEAKAVLGGVSYKHKLPETDPRWGVPYEIGGYKIANKVMVGDVEVEFDIRFVGDGYYDEGWQKDMLRNRKRTKCFYTLNDEDYFYSLVYHGLLHKRSLSKTYINRFAALAHAACLKIDEATLKNEVQLWDLLRRYLKANNYDLTIPIEKNIPFNFRGYEF